MRWKISVLGQYSHETTSVPLGALKSTIQRLKREHPDAVIQRWASSRIPLLYAHMRFNSHHELCTVRKIMFDVTDGHSSFFKE